MQSSTNSAKKREIRLFLLNRFQQETAEQAKMFKVITCDNVCELLLMERRVTGKLSCTVRSGGKAGNVRYCRLTYRYKKNHKVQDSAGSFPQSPELC